METYQNSSSHNSANTHHSHGKCEDNCTKGEFIKSDRELLHAVAKTTSMALESIKDLLASLEESKITDTLKHQQEIYEDLYRLSRHGLTKIEEEVDKIATMQKMMLWTGTKWNLMMDDSQTKIAEMLIEGTSMGVIEVGRALNDYKEVSSKTCVCLAEKCMHDMSEFVDQLKTLL